MTYLVGALSMAVLTAGWVLVQRYVAQREPEVRGPEDSVGGCCGACANKTCEREGARG